MICGKGPKAFEKEKNKRLEAEKMASDVVQEKNSSFIVLKKEDVQNAIYLNYFIAILIFLVAIFLPLFFNGSLTI